MAGNLLLRDQIPSEASSLLYRRRDLQYHRNRADVYGCGYRRRGRSRHPKPQCAPRRGEPAHVPEYTGDLRHHRIRIEFRDAGLRSEHSYALLQQARLQVRLPYRSFRRLHAHLVSHNAGRSRQHGGRQVCALAGPRAPRPLRLRPLWLRPPCNGLAQPARPRSDFLRSRDLESPPDRGVHRCSGFPRATGRR